MNVIGNEAPSSPPGCREDWVCAERRQAGLPEQSPYVPKDLPLRVGAGDSGVRRKRLMRKGESERGEFFFDHVQELWN